MVMEKQHFLGGRISFIPGYAHMMFSQAVNDMLKQVGKERCCDARMCNHRPSRISFRFCFGVRKERDEEEDNLCGRDRCVICIDKQIRALRPCVSHRVDESELVVGGQRSASGVAHLTPTHLTSNLSVALGGMSGGAPFLP